MSENRQNCAYHYTVKRGDSFYLIAQRLGVSLRDLLEANPDLPPARLMIGDVLCVPYSQDVQTPAGEKTDGGTDSGADNTGNTGSTGSAGNTGNTGNTGTTAPDTSGGANPDKPECVCPEPNPDTPEETPPDEICPPNRRTIVQDGQTASDLQLRYDLSYYTLQQANEQTDLDAIKGGDVVCIPQRNLPCNLPTTVTLGENDTLESIAVTYNVPIASLLRVNPCLAPEDFRKDAVIRLPN